ncbi:glycosyltransferase family 4 protein [Calothrix sp. UHCC 0171]|uniref:glycosyltransferase family 4 protein n=1 Tax=Calothrix sp. UHCC 0171 TaxID=3110245 RepID=UPI002B1F8363|nr:glycosyltransferase family 4 protein [Calothrix sp. UHCC 0171]MEA5569478.1 glycosyltransferase family 4 protein [Calothrix sp. UHCC 0171]
MLKHRIKNSLQVVFLWDWEDNPYKTLLKKHLNNLGIKVEDCVWKSSEPPLFLKKILPNLKKNFDILHFQTLHPFILPKNANTKISIILKIVLFIYQSLILKIQGIKLIWTVHEWSNKVDTTNNFNRLQGLILGYCLDGIITHCDRTKKEVESKFLLTNKSKVHVVPHGNYINYYKNETERLDCRHQLGISAENIVFLIFGYIYRYKGILETIDCFQQLNENHNNITLLIAGKPCEENLEELINHRIRESPNILFFPAEIADEQVQIYFNACDCVIIPYKVFTTSGVALLAMSFGKACIAPSVGFFADILDNSVSFLYDSNDEEGLLKSLQAAVANHEQLSAMGENNLQLANQYNWDSIAHKTLKIYEKYFTHLRRQ